MIYVEFDHRLNNFAAHGLRAGPREWHVHVLLIVDGSADCKKSGQALQMPWQVVLESSLQKCTHGL